MSMHEFMNRENPGSPPVSRKPRDKKNRIPMSIPQQKLQVPEIPGWHLYWALEDNLPRFFDGGYELVDESEVDLNQTGLGSNHTMSGNNDLGSRVAIVAGKKESGDTDWFVLVKIEDEYYLEDQKKIEDHNRRILKAIFKEKRVIDQGGEGMNPGDTGQRYVKQADLAGTLFQRRHRKHV